MVALACGVLQCSDNIPFFQLGVILKDLGMSRPSRQQVKDVLDPYTQPPDTRPTAAVLWICGYAI